jgi:hypothetical protein
MANISVEEAQAWLNEGEADLGELNTDLETQVSTQVLSQLAPAYEVSGWTTPNTTPSLVRSVIAMYYIAMYYDRQTAASLSDQLAAYAVLLRQRADLMIQGILTGAIDLLDVEGVLATSLGPVFFPDDSTVGTVDDVRFAMGTVF